METTTKRTAYTVQQVRWLTDSVYVLRFDRGGISVEPGQYVSVGPTGTIDMREYSVYSAPDEPWFEILVKVVEGGYVSRVLAQLNPGDPLNVDGPFGFFTIDPDWREHSYRFIATGTGISPFHAIIQAYPGIDYRLFHGTRHLDERFELEAYDTSRIIRCISREPGGDIHGRVTDALRSGVVEPEARYYLCGNCDMIYEAFDILQDAGVPHANLFAEVYF